MTALAAFALAAALTSVLVPLAIALARRTQFYDHPAGYKGHVAPTPYLGGLAVFGGFAVAALIFGGGTGTYWVPLACAAVLVGLGTLDDRRPTAPIWRVIAEVGAAVAVYAADLGWAVFDLDALNLLLTVAWVLGLCNAFNLMDNLDGATGSVAGVSALGIGATALVFDGAEMAAFGFALAGACAAFLRYNLARPARIFLGDGGSLPIGFLVAAGAMIVSQGPALRASAVLFAALLVALAIFDTTLVVLSRRRAGVPLMTAGRDHLTHRLLSRLDSPWRVALVLGLMQAWLCAAAIIGAEAGSIAIAGVAATAVIGGVVALGVLESGGWRPERPAPAGRPEKLKVETRSSTAPSG